jgi:CDP-4-dehydro-6-deoxyglucose reductase
MYGLFRPIPNASVSNEQTATIRIASTGREFTARGDETILTAALRQGIVLPYSCRNGTCASCKCRLVEGEIHYPYNPPAALDSDEIHDGQMLSCQAVAQGDVVIESREIEQVEDIPVRLLPARVETMDRFTDDTMRLRLKLPSAARLQFLAGQYIDILLPEGKRRAFSLASPPSQSEFIELHVKHVDGGGFTGHVFSDMAPKEILRFEGPLGTFFFRRQSDRPAVLVGGGTGFAPLKAMVEELMHAGDDRPLELFWGTRSADDLYAAELIRSWQDTHPSLNFVPVVSEPDAAWRGETGFVHEAVLKKHPDLSGWDVYMSGPPAMIHAARSAFIDAGVPEDRLFYDSFDFAPDVPPAAD